jgi:CheY-like chemotaxis protein
MDISMPDLNGFEATLALRQDLRTGNHHFGFHRIG